jgi:hypothetical protein
LGCDAPIVVKKPPHTQVERDLTFSRTSGMFQKRTRGLAPALEAIERRSGAAGGKHQNAAFRKIVGPLKL